MTGLDRAGLVISQRKLSCSTAQSSQLYQVYFYFYANPPSLSSSTLYLPAVSEKHIILNIEELPVVLHVAGVTKVIDITAKVLSRRLTEGLVLQGER